MTEPIIRFEKVNKWYGNDFHVLRDIDLEVAKGERIVVCGPSGSGKSTLIRCINRLVEPTAGKVRLNHLDVTALGPRDLRRARRRIGMIFQEYALVERLTVMENVLSGRLGYVPFWRSFTRRFPSADIRRAYRLLDRVGLSAHVDKRADALSGGQRQRVGIARALEQEPELLLIDEPTASLDPRTSRQIMRLITEICREDGLPAIINIHDVLLAQQFADRIIGLQAGRVVFDGPPSALTDAVLTRIYGAEDWTAMQKSAAEDAEDEAQARADADRLLEAL